MEGGEKPLETGKIPAVCGHCLHLASQAFEAKPLFEMTSKLSFCQSQPTNLLKKTPTILFVSLQLVVVSGFGIQYGVHKYNYLQFKA